METASDAIAPAKPAFLAPIAASPARACRRAAVLELSGGKGDDLAGSTNTTS